VADEAPETAEPSAGFEQKRVLVVDDEAGVGELVSDLLADLGCRATRVTKAREVLPLLSRKPFDRSIDLRISRLRCKIEMNPTKPEAIRTARGIGQVFD